MTSIFINGQVLFIGNGKECKIGADVYGSVHIDKVNKRNYGLRVLYPNGDRPLVTVVDEWKVRNYLDA